MVPLLASCFLCCTDRGECLPSPSMTSTSIDDDCHLTNDNNLFFLTHCPHCATQSNWPQNTKLCQDHTWIQMKRCSPQKEHDDICWYKYPLKSWLSLVAKFAIVLIWYSHIFWYFFESSLISQHWACFFRVFSLQPPTNIHVCRQNIPRDIS